MMSLFGAEAVQKRESKLGAEHRSTKKENAGNSRTLTKSNITPRATRPLAPGNNYSRYPYSIPTPERATTPGRDLVWPLHQETYTKEANNQRPNTSNSSVPQPRRKNKLKIPPVRYTLASQLRLPEAATNLPGGISRAREVDGNQTSSTLVPQDIQVLSAARSKSIQTTKSEPDICLDDKIHRKPGKRSRQRRQCFRRWRRHQEAQERMEATTAAR